MSSVTVPGFMSNSVKWTNSHSSQEGGQRVRKRSQPLFCLFFGPESRYGFQSGLELTTEPRQPLPASASLPEAGIPGVRHQASSHPPRGSGCPQAQRQSRLTPGLRLQPSCCRFGLLSGLRRSRCPLWSLGYAGAPPSRP